MNTVQITRRGMLGSLGAALLAPGAMAGQRDQSARSASLWADLELLDADDRSFRIGDRGKKLTLIMLWANWCAACLRELETVPEIAPAIGPDIDVILVSHPDDWGRNLRLTRARNMTVRCARPSSENRQSTLQSALLAADGRYYVPRNVLFSPSRGGVIWSHVGGIDWTDPEAAALLRRWMG